MVHIFENIGTKLDTKAVALNPRDTTRRFWLGWMVAFWPIFLSDIIHTMMVLWFGPVPAMIITTVYVMTSLYIGMKLVAKV